MGKRHDAPQVQLVRAVPFRHGRCCKWLGWWTTGIGHANIDAAKMVMDGVGEVSNAFVFGNVERCGVDFYAVQSSRLFGNLVQGLCVASTDGEIGTFGCESQRRGTTNSFAGCGNNGDAISESSFHEVSININSSRVLLDAIHRPVRLLYLGPHEREG